MSANKGVLKDYYAIMGVPATASQAEIKAAWKKLVKEWHPDVCPRADAHLRFTQFSEAYHILQDVQARRRYDSQVNMHDLIFYRNQRDFRGCRDEAWQQAEHFAAPPREYLLEMMETTLTLTQCVFLSWYNAVFWYPFGCLDSSEGKRTS